MQTIVHDSRSAPVDVLAAGQRRLDHLVAKGRLPTSITSMSGSASTHPLCIVLGAMTAFYWVVIAAFAAKTAAHAVVNTPGYAVALSLAPC
jgi:hypothetical protein